eukprot:gene20282-28712_t
MAPQVEVLEHHGQLALGRCDIVGTYAADVQIAAADLFQTGDHAQQSGLAAAGRADEHHQLAVGDIEVD